MNNFTRLVLAFSALPTLSTPVCAQQRSVDMAVTLLSPQDGGSYQGGEQVSFIVSLKNNGPASLVAGDTLFYPLPQGGIGVLNLQHAINAGQTDTIINTEISFSAVDTPVAGAFCTHVAWDPTAELMVPVTYKDPNPANNEDCSQITINPQVTSISDVGNNDSRLLNLYPNPAASSVRLSLNLDKTEDIIISIRDLSGRKILHRSYSRMEKEATITLNVAGLINGFYFVELVAGEQIRTGKLMIQR